MFVRTCRTPAQSNRNIGFDEAGEFNTLNSRLAGDEVEGKCSSTSARFCSVISVATTPIAVGFASTPTPITVKKESWKSRCSPGYEF